MVKTRGVWTMRQGLFQDAPKVPRRDHMSVII
jgi:hypothetical protein